MALWTDYLTKHLIDENHPTLHQPGCLNTVQTRRTCTICKDLCPHGVFDRAEPNWEYCDNCGACVAACPQSCIVPSTLFTTAALEHCDRLRGDVVIGCQAHTDPCDWRVPCLAAIAWELLAFFALDGTVTLLRGACDDCPHHALWQQWQQTLDTARRFLDDPPDEGRIVCCTEGQALPARGLSRREAIGLLVSRSRSTIAGLLPEDRKLAPDGTLFRRLLLSRLRRLEPARSFRWTIPAIGEDCTACGLCSRLCPTDALQQVEDEVDETGRKTWYLALVPWRCTACGLCTETCPGQTILPPTAVPLTDPRRPLLLPITGYPCTRCGAPAPDRDQLCSRCRGELGIRDKTNKTDKAAAQIGDDHPPAAQ